MTRTLLAFVVAVTIIGCTQTYRKPGVTQDQADIDTRYCQAMARGGSGFMGEGLAGVVSGMEAQQARYEACLMRLGYLPAD